MRKLIFFVFLSFLVFLPGCYAPSKVTVYGSSGKSYIAPDLCAAFLACVKSTETNCFYNSDITRNVDGSYTENTCKEVKK